MRDKESVLGLGLLRVVMEGLFKDKTFEWRLELGGRLLRTVAQVVGCTVEYGCSDQALCARDDASYKGAKWSGSPWKQVYNDQGKEGVFLAERNRQYMKALRDTGLA